MEDVELGTVVKHLVNSRPTRQVVDVKFSNNDINYLQRKTGVDHRTVGHALAFFGEAVVLESLRRFQRDWSSAYFWGVCRKVAGGQ